MAGTVEDPFTIAFECSGNARAAEAALDQLDYAGTLVFVGTGHEWPRINHNRTIVLELTLIGAYNYEAAGFAPALELLASGALPLDALIEPDDVLLDGLLPAMERLAAGELAGKVMVRPEVARGGGHHERNRPDAEPRRDVDGPGGPRRAGPRRHPLLLRRGVRLDRGRQHR